MADRIVNNMMAFRSEVPWHGKGYGCTQEDLSKLATMTAGERVEFWLNAAKLNWSVQRRALAMRGDLTNAHTDASAMLTEPLKGYRAIVRADTDEVFQVASNAYQMVQNREIVEFFTGYCDAGHAQIETVGAIDGGAKIWALAKVTDDSHAFTVGKDDKADAYILLATSHDGSLQTVGKPTTVYVVCWNTLSGALGVGNGARLGRRDPFEFRANHRRKWTVELAAEAKRVMGMAVESAHKQAEVANRLARVQVDERGRVEFIQRLIGGESLLEQVVADSAPMQHAHAGNGASLLSAMVDNHAKVGASDTPVDLGKLGKALLEAMVNAPGQEIAERKDTLWGAVNGVTYHVDHERGRTQDTRLGSAWFGDGARLKQSAVGVALEMAGVDLPYTTANMRG